MNGSSDSFKDLILTGMFDPLISILSETLTIEISGALPLGILIALWILRSAAKGPSDKS